MAQGDVKPATAARTVAGVALADFVGGQAYAGFTASTFSATNGTNAQRILGWRLTTDDPFFG